MKLEHVTMDTGHVASHDFSDFDATMAFRLRPLLKEARRENGVELFDCTCLRMMADEEGRTYVATLYDVVAEPIPLLVTAGARDGKAVEKVWQMMHDFADTLGSRVATDRRSVPEGPWVVDKVVVPLPSQMDAFFWSGDLAKCLGWMMLFPDDVARALRVK